MSRNRNFTFTLNNYTAEDESRIQLLEVKYLVYGRERGSSGTKHLQGYVCWKNPKSLSATRALLPRAHIEVARGSHSQASNYCKKGQGTEFDPENPGLEGQEEYQWFQKGVVPGEPRDGGEVERARWESTWSLAKQGDIEEIDADIRIRCYSTVKKIARDYQGTVPRLESTCGIWIHGLARCGKTTSVCDAYPDLYPKGVNKWWCGYQGEEVVLLDDIDPSHGPWLGGLLKRWADKFPFIGEEKGGSRKIRPKKFFVTSQYRIEDIWQDEETRAALLGRFDVIEKIGGQNIIL